MDLFSVIDDAVAIVRTSGGVFKQTKVFRRAERIFVQHGSGFLRVTAKFGDTWGTSHPSTKVVDIEGEGIDLSRGEPRYRASLRAAA